MMNSISIMKSISRKLSFVKIGLYEDHILELNTNGNSPVGTHQLQDLQDGPLEAAFTYKRMV